MTQSDCSLSTKWQLKPLFQNEVITMHFLYNEDMQSQFCLHGIEFQSFSKRNIL